MRLRFDSNQFQPCMYDVKVLDRMYEVQVSDKIYYLQDVESIYIIYMYMMFFDQIR